MARGGARPGAGRKAGAPNKVTAEAKEIARKYGPGAIEALAEIAGLVEDKTAADSDAAKIAALKELLDRAYGKAPQSITGEGGEGPVLLELMNLVDGKTRGLPTGS